MFEPAVNERATDHLDHFVDVSLARALREHRNSSHFDADGPHGLRPAEARGEFDARFEIQFAEQKIVAGKLLVLVILFSFVTADPSVAEIPFRRVVVDPSPPLNPWVKIVGDFNGDGLIDIAIGGSRGPLVWYVNPSWQPVVLADGGYSTVDGEAVDIDGDDDLDVILGGVVWYENPRPKGKSTRDRWTMHRIGQRRTHDVEVADLDRDGRLDVVSRNQSRFGNRDGDRFFLWKQQDADEWTSREIRCPHGEGLRLGDIDDDGDADVVIAGRWYENHGDIAGGSWPEHVFAKNWSHPDAKVELHDFNADGRLDVVLTPAELKGEIYRIGWYQAPSDPQELWTQHVIQPAVEAVYHSLAVADMNLDGNPDVVTARMHQGTDPDEMSVYLNLGGGLKWTKQVVSTKGSHDIVVADIDNDGDFDIVGANHGGRFQPVELWENLHIKD